MTTAPMPAAEPKPRPLLRIDELHIEGFRSLRRVHWPDDGMGWGGRIPDVVVMGGVNGSGKTTLLTLLPLLADSMRGFESFADFAGSALRASVTFGLCAGLLGETALGVAVGSPPPRLMKSSERLHFKPIPSGYAASGSPHDWLGKTLASDAEFHSSDLPSVLLFTTHRELTIPKESFKTAGRLGRQDAFLRVFEGSPNDWKQSFEAVLYDARWRDLNAKEQGRLSEAHHFADYATAFRRFFRGTKQLVWSAEGELFVEVTGTGERHDLNALSSGEKQVVLLTGELYRNWRPGSLVLIDEPELHLHPTWQTTLYEMIVEWQRERGGQVILATQSNHLFRIAEPNTTVLLGAEPP